VKTQGETALFRAILLSAALSAVKYGFGVASGSMLVLASAADSFADACASGVNWWGYRFAREPADSEHPYGHGKVEAVLSAGQGMLLVGVAVSVAVGGITGLLEGREVPDTGLAAIAMTLSVICSGALWWNLERARRVEGGLVLQADAAHYRVDLLSGIGALVGLGAVWQTGWAWLDPALALPISLAILHDAWPVLRNAFSELLDEALPEEEQLRVERVLKGLTDEEDLIFHGLRTRRSGPIRFVEVHLDLPAETPLGIAHTLVQDIARQVREVLPGESRVLVHPDAHGFEDVVDAPLE
jgi:cation diffusion facilitator family transporter